MRAPMKAPMKADTINCLCPGHFQCSLHLPVQLLCEIKTSKWSVSVGESKEIRVDVCAMSFSWDLSCW